MHTLLIETETTCIVGKHLQAYSYFISINCRTNSCSYYLFVHIRCIDCFYTLADMFTLFKYFKWGFCERTYSVHYWKTIIMFSYFSSYE